jgi:multiple sugar transport system ATP-binding protein
VVVIEPSGSETHVILRAGQVDISVVCRERVSVRSGDILHVVSSPSKMHLFDEVTGSRLAMV